MATSCNTVKYSSHPQCSSCSTFSKLCDLIQTKPNREVKEPSRTVCLVAEPNLLSRCYFELSWTPVSSAVLVVRSTWSNANGPAVCISDRSIDRTGHFFLLRDRVTLRWLEVVVAVRPPHFPSLSALGQPLQSSWTSTAGRLLECYHPMRSSFSLSLQYNLQFVRGERSMWLQGQLEYECFLIDDLWLKIWVSSSENGLIMATF